jgi:hypothetical protein
VSFGPSSLWAAVSGVYEVRHFAPTFEVCPSCSDVALDRVAVERARQFVFAPIRSLPWRAYVKCRSCSHRAEAEPPSSLPPRRLGWRIAMNWVIVATGLALAVVMAISAADDLGARARSPNVGDEWTVQVWRIHGLEGEREFGRVRVTAVDDERVHVAACAFTASIDSQIASHCHTFPVLDAAELARAEIVALAANGGIRAITRPSAELGWPLLALVACAAAWIANGISAARLARGFDVPTARTISGSG